MLKQIGMSQLRGENRALVAPMITLFNSSGACAFGLEKPTARKAPAVASNTKKSGSQKTRFGFRSVHEIS